MGVGDFIANPRIFETPHSLSTLLPDYVINPHPRFAALTRNIRVRRGGKVDIRVPLFQDERTPEVLREAGKLDAITGQGSTPSYSIDADHFEPDLDIHMDTMGFGMGMCCLVRCQEMRKFFASIDNLYYFSILLLLLMILLNSFRQLLSISSLQL